MDEYLIGDIDAWTESIDFLEKSFILVDQFLELCERKNVFLCGRRGAGKSAIAIMLGRKGNTRYDHCLTIKGEAETYGTYIPLIDALEGGKVEVKRFVTLLWSYALRILVMRTIVDYAAKGTIQSSKDISEIHTYLVSVGYNSSNIASILIKGYRDAVGAGSLQEPISIYNALVTMTDNPMFKSAVLAIPRALRSESLMIVFDTLESYKVYSHSMKQGLVGIIDSILGVVKDPSLSQIGVRFFIPAEIFEDLSISAPGKIGGNTVFLRWRFSDLLEIGRASCRERV